MRYEPQHLLAVRLRNNELERMLRQAPILQVERKSQTRAAHQLAKPLWGIRKREKFS